ncbi:MAG: hypothetical protein WBV82_02625 [Myxococcaceae bacterium]
MTAVLLALLLSTDGGTEPVALCLKQAQWVFPKGAQVPPHERPTAEEQAKAPKAYFVKIDDRDRVDVSRSDVRLDGLDPTTEHRARIFADDRPIASFRFTFKDGPSLALDHNLFYGEQSWYVRKAAKRDCAAVR